MEPTKRTFAHRLWAMLPGIAVTVLFLLVIGLMVRISDDKKRLEAQRLEELKKSQPPINVVVQVLKPEPIRDSVNLPAQVEPWEALTVLAEVPGKVAHVPLAQGVRVSKGDVIAVLDRRDYDNALQSARAAYQLAQTSLERATRLTQQEITPAVSLDEARANAMALEAALKQAELNLERTVITAPLSGVLNRLDAKEGMYLASKDSVALILQTDPVKVAVGIPESDVAAARSIGQFTLHVDALGGRAFQGRRHFLSQAPETLAHLYRLEIAVSNPTGELLPGMFAKVDVVKKTLPNAISVPLYSIITRGEDKFVYLEKDGMVHRRDVKTGVLEGWRVEVTEGLMAGDRIIVVGHRNVSEGQAVNVIRTVTDPVELMK